MLYHFEGVNDRFAVMNYKYANHYAYRIKELANYRKKHGRIVSEKYTKFIVNKYFKKILINFSFKIIRPSEMKSDNVDQINFFKDEMRIDVISESEQGNHENASALFTDVAKMYYRL